MKRLLVSLSVFLFLASFDFAEGAEARVTRVVKDVEVLVAPKPPRRAVLNDAIQDGMALQTGVNSQTELQFTNGGLARLGSNTVFGIGRGTRRMGLAQGAMLIRAPAGAGEAQVKTASVSTDVKGTTSILEYYPNGYIKLIVLEGTARMFMPGVLGESVLVNAGQLLMFHTKTMPTSLPSPVDVDLKRLTATSLLIQGFPPLGSESSISKGVQSQTKQKSEGALADTNLVIFGRGTLVNLVPPSAEESARLSTSKPSPSPTPLSRQSPARTSR